jgi:GT2 family glycosyltransferase
MAWSRRSASGIATVKLRRLRKVRISGGANSGARHIVVMEPIPLRHQLTLTVVVPTWRRTDALDCCLEGLARQRRPPNEVLVVHRPDDVKTKEFLSGSRSGSLPVRGLVVGAPGLVAARNAALAEARGDVVAFIDDDAVPHEDWTARITSAFSSDQELGGLGGRDLIQSDRLPLRDVIGKVQWFGRTIGNHHLGVGPAREVDFLKGCNMSYRARAVSRTRFDHRLRSSGAQVCEDMAFCLKLKRAGWKLEYDPAVAVDHRPAPAADGHRSVSVNSVADATHNETLTIIEHLPPLRRPIYLLWAVLIGTRGTPGFAQVPRLIAWYANWPSILLASLRGRVLGLRTAIRSARCGCAELSECSPVTSKCSK